VFKVLIIHINDIHLNCSSHVTKGTRYLVECELKLHYLQNLSHEGAYMPWISKGQASDPIVADD
jgi:hypothetical protein